MIVSMCVDVMANRRQPIAGFIGHDQEPAYYCAKCFVERVEEALREGMTPREIAANVNFTRCGHVEDGDSATQDCMRCAKAMMAMLTFVAMRMQLKPTTETNPASHKLLNRLEETVRMLIKRYGRIHCETDPRHRKKAEAA